MLHLVHQSQWLLVHRLPNMEQVDHRGSQLDRIELEQVSVLVELEQVFVLVELEQVFVLVELEQVSVLGDK